MANRDLNRFRKIYPHKRVRPKNFLLAEDQTAFVESSYITYSSAESGTHNFTTAFPEAPVVTVTSVDSESNDLANINTYVMSVSTTSVTIETSANFTGRVHFHAIHQVI